MKKFRKILCFLMAGMMLALTLAGCGTTPGGNEETKENQNMEHETAGAVALARYPVQAKYPTEDDFKDDKGYIDYDAYDKAMNEWRQNNRESSENFTRYYYGGEMDVLVRGLAKELLADSKNDNVICSPVNIYMALAMLAEVTDGDTRKEVLDVLGTDSIDELRDLATRIWLSAYLEDGVSSEILASSIWLRDDMSYKKDALEKLAEIYYASSFAGQMGSKEYDKQLQDWINEQTGGLLEQQASGLHFDPQTIMGIAATIYFKEKWDGTFLEEYTAPRTFHGKNGDEETDFMNGGETAAYYWTDNFSATTKYFQKNGGMTFILPDEGITPEELMTDETFLKFVCGDKEAVNGSRVLVCLSVPKFDVDSDRELIPTLSKLGITGVFDNNADFTPLSDQPGIFVSKVEHAARVKIDEEGCEAAAYTVMMMETTAMEPQDKVDFVLDRPFIFVINDTNGMPLFIGIVNTVQK